MDSDEIFKYISYVDFLKDYYLQKNVANPHFNFSVWAKKLNLTNVATLTRILNGGRLPGPKLISAFEEYFKFTPVANEYFGTLIRLHKELDPAVRELYHGKLKELRQRQAGGAKPLLELQSHNLNLWGSADPTVFGEYLDSFGFESIMSYSGSKNSLCLNGAKVLNSGIGPFTQFSFACYTKRKGAPWGQSEMFFSHLYCSDQGVADQFQKWGSPYLLRSLRSKLGAATEAQQFSLLGADRPDVFFSMGKVSKELLPSHQPNNVLSYNQLHAARFTCPMTFDSVAYCRDFDPEVDQCEWDIHSEMGSFLERIRFRPAYWTYHPEFHCRIFPFQAQ